MAFSLSFFDLSAVSDMPGYVCVFSKTQLLPSSLFSLSNLIHITDFNHCLCVDGSQISISSPKFFEEFQFLILKMLTYKCFATTSNTIGLKWNSCVL